MRSRSPSESDGGRTVRDEEDSASISALGKPSKKQLFDHTHLLAAAVSLICLLLGILTVTPNLKIAWSLRFSGQIVVIGFLLGIMNLCLQTIVPYSFLVLEARFGQSRLQNYEALLTGKIFLPNTSFTCRVALSLLVALPLGLSVAYKRFLGGTSSGHIAVVPPGEYGIDFPRVGSWAPPNDPIYFLTTSISPWLTASQFSPTPYPSEYPVAYGYNTLLLGTDSAALLDIPTGSYIADAQSLMSSGEFWNISASVNAYVAVHDNSSDFRTNNKTWIDAIETSIKDSLGGLSTIYLYQGGGARIGFMPTGANDECYFGLYYNSSDWGGLSHYGNPEEPDFTWFRKRAYKFKLKRARCHGHWQMNSTSIVLVNGDCDLNQAVDSSILQGKNMVPVDFDVLPTQQHIFGTYAKNPDSIWLSPSYAISVVTIYWARALYAIYGQGAKPSNYTGSYVPVDEVITSERSTLNAAPLLYVVLAVQPIITIIALAITAWLYHVPLGRGFGIISILSGFEPSMSQSIQGAGLSGKLRAPVKLEVTAKRFDDARIRYRLLSDRSAFGKVVGLRKGQTYE